MSASSVSRENVALTDAQRRQLGAVLDVLASDEHAPSAVRERGAAERVHVADSLAALELERVRTARRIADLGSGAGFPGIALAVALPQACVHLIESQRRKREFLVRVCAQAGIGNARPVCARAEEWREGIGRCQLVLARALASQPVVLEYAAPLLELGGALVDWRGRRDREEEQRAERAAALLGLERSEVRRVVPFAGATDRHLHVFEKRAETPRRFPRRAGVARKHPLGG
ncbi:MAG TPA: 16S rRNA (guanine(527)-N(7))-methyltransferase RsmG [Solirubrobacteraceae bacterium]|nr:16S rRNA (guanine(527)-N(7))-methyltransferase RsmG [Solirubrobacteraceae bacterium]HUB74704.1 16S rRNA (guanine(527)-N(7))-methyltransferase RsmG [Solirubrobacteraceae bacterium]